MSIKDTCLAKISLNRFTIRYYADTNYILMYKFTMQLVALSLQRKQLSEQCSLLIIALSFLLDAMHVLCKVGSNNI